MKKKSDGMSPDMYRDATPSKTIPVVTPVEGTKNEAPNLLQNETEEFTGVRKPTPVNLQAEIIKVNFDKQTVSARALFNFIGLAERFSAWWTRMISYGLEENVDFATVGFPTVVNNGGTKEIGDYLLTIEAAKHIAMVQRNEKGKQDFFCLEMLPIQVKDYLCHRKNNSRTVERSTISCFLIFV